MKKKFIDAHMKVAETYAKLSSAKKLQVGSVIVKDDTIIGIGYNGMPSGWDNNCENKVYDWSRDINGDYFSDSREYYPLDDDNGRYRLETKTEVIHAESNAISKVAKSTHSTENSDMFITHAPCLQCAKLIHQSGIRKVYYRNSYRDNDGIEFLTKCGIEIEQV